MNDKELKFVYPTSDDFLLSSVESIHGMWQNNNQYFLEIIQNQKIPFFGTSGKPGAEMTTIIETKRTRFNRVSTFFNKPNNHLEFLANLLVICGSAVGRAFFTVDAEKDPGGIFIMLLENEEGKNFTFYWEDLKGTIGCGKLKLDKGEDATLIDLIDHLNERDNYPARVDLAVNSDNYDNVIKSCFTKADAEVFMTKLSKDHTILAKSYLKDRLFVQAILFKSLQVLGVISEEEKYARSTSL